MRLVKGGLAPDFQTADHLGNPLGLASLQGRPVLLSFYRYASCPVCNLRVRRVTEAYPAWQQRGLAVLAVFQSPAASVLGYVGRQGAPFPILPDPEMRLYRQYGVESRWAGLLTGRVVRAALAAFRQGFLPGRIEGPMNRTPADFLIDPDGRIAVAHYGADIDDHLPLATISAWLETHPTV